MQKERTEQSEENFHVYKKKKSQSLMKFTKNGLITNEQIRRIENVERERKIYRYTFLHKAHFVFG